MNLYKAAARAELIPNPERGRLLGWYTVHWGSRQEVRFLAGDVYTVVAELGGMKIGEAASFDDAVQFAREVLVNREEGTTFEPTDEARGKIVSTWGVVRAEERGMS